MKACHLYWSIMFYILNLFKFSLPRIKNVCNIDHKIKEEYEKWGLNMNTLELNTVVMGRRRNNEFEIVNDIVQRDTIVVSI